MSPLKVRDQICAHCVADLAKMLSLEMLFCGFRINQISAMIALAYDVFTLLMNVEVLFRSTDISTEVAYVNLVLSLSMTLEAVGW
jgi:hypothetical protein